MQSNLIEVENEYFMDFKQVQCNQNQENNEYYTQKTQGVEDIRKSHMKCGEIYITGIENFKFVCMLCEKTFFTFIEEFLSHVAHCQPKDEICTIEIDPLESQQDFDYSPVEQKSSNVIPKEEVENSFDSTLDPIEMLSLVDHTEKLQEKFDLLERQYMSSSDNYSCNQCDRVYSWKKSLERHLKAVHRSDVEVSSVYVYCNVPDCKKKFKKNESLDIHKRFEHKQDPEELTVDENGYSQVKTYEDNSEEPKEKFDRYTCKYCGQRFTAPYKRAEHERIHTGEKPFNCTICGKGFRIARSRNTHELTHQGIKPYKCEICNTEFSEKSNLTQHIHRHTDGKKYKCEFCVKTFHSKAEKNVHERTHTGEKSYLCFECGHRFLTASKLNSHIKRHTGVKPFKCDQCEKTFFSKQLLKDHYIVHTGEKPFTCHICGSKFPRRKSMKSHIKIHSDIAQYSCTICGKSFKQGPGLYSHMKSHGKVLTKS